MEEGHLRQQGHQVGVLELPDVGGRQRLQLPREEQFAMPQLVLEFLRQVHHLRVLHLFLHFP